MIADRMRILSLLAGAIGLSVLLYASVFAYRDVLGVDIMEARNLITAREMIETGRWLLPTLHGEPRLAKPPLPTWLTAVAMLIGNDGQDTDLSLNRIPSALAALLLAVSLFGLTRFWTKSTAAAAWATAFLATSYMFVLMARRNSWDIYCHAFMLAAIWGMAMIVESPSSRRKLAVATGILLGLSGLSKGPVGYYALLLPFAVALLATGGMAGFRSHARDLGLALGIGVVLSSAWPAVAWMAMPHDFSRMLATERDAWFTEHTKPFWFYLQFPLMTGIWSLFAVAALWPGHARSRVEPLLPYRRPVVWCLGCVLLLMLVPEKKDRYLLPALIPLSQLMGAYLTGLLRDPEKGGRIGRALVVTNSMIFGLACVGVPAALFWLRPRFPFLDVLGLAAAATVAVLGTAAVFLLYLRQHVAALFVTKFAILGLCLLALPALVRQNAGNLSVPLAEIRAFVEERPVVADGSLKLQDSWIIGKKPLAQADYGANGLPESLCFVSRKNYPVLPGALSGYTSEKSLKFSDLSGDVIHLVKLERRGEK